MNPLVWVIEPALRLRSGHDRLPHAYYFAAKPEEWPLCLFFHPDQEWSETDWIADTIIPWAAEWLLFYEGWLATGVWHGGGLHFGDEEYQRWEATRRNPGMVPPDQAVPFSKRAENWIGRRTGTFVCSALMAAASRGFSPPLSSHDWNLNLDDI